MEIIETGYKQCGWYKQLDGRAKGKCESNTVCGWCMGCLYNSIKPIKAF